MSSVELSVVHCCLFMRARRYNNLNIQSSCFLYTSITPENFCVRACDLNLQRSCPEMNWYVYPHRKEMDPIQRLSGNWNVFFLFRLKNDVERWNVHLTPLEEQSCFSHVLKSGQSWGWAKPRQIRYQTGGWLFRKLRAESVNKRWCMRVESEHYGSDHFLVSKIASPSLRPLASTLRYSLGSSFHLAL